MITKHPPGDPMTRGNMRQLGVQRLVAENFMRTRAGNTLALAPGPLTCTLARAVR